MGSTVSPIMANLFMEDYEGKALEAYQDPPKYWGRYVDDVLAVIKTANIEPFTQHLNAQHTSIQWTSELETGGKLPMLDTLPTRRTDGSLKFSVYRKPTHTEYLQFQSHQPMEHKMSVIRTLTHRADTIISDPQDKERETKHLKKVLSVAGYSRWAWQAQGEKEDQTTSSEHRQGQGSRDPPLHRRRDRTHLQPNQEDRGRSPCQAPHHHQEHTSGTERQRQSPGQMWRGIPTDMPRL